MLVAVLIIAAVLPSSSGHALWVPSNGTEADTDNNMCMAGAFDQKLATVESDVQSDDSECCCVTDDWREDMPCDARRHCERNDGKLIPGSCAETAKEAKEKKWQDTHGSNPHCCVLASEAAWKGAMRIILGWTFPAFHGDDWEEQKRQHEYKKLVEGVGQGGFSASCYRIHSDSLTACKAETMHMKSQGLFLSNQFLKMPPLEQMKRAKESCDVWPCREKKTLRLEHPLVKDLTPRKLTDLKRIAPDTRYSCAADATPCQIDGRCQEGLVCVSSRAPQDVEGVAYILSDSSERDKRQPCIHSRIAWLSGLAKSTRAEAANLDTTGIVRNSALFKGCLCCKDTQAGNRR
ncbi:unnamed protein product [Vitrella brassicaformis CCMP3155]|uniref:Uncharacterized protein n=2 Tax=Vitrella brassicaformis TaxID=1169539 RepID=A0A0G4EHD1_VITBC|nr:unnamed protein product [Vitrella brassicaformis CCMP3155]|mmetsp:Transcript_19639/g.47598  ORF Transcript_19639/g.47598 Transcript_19639/m.47598 type:complete len:348 (+) Transcript_19639:1-1044(+)|eukprot:CEL95435.1 unnamed protein product [Vitrella brassicaformis CCMP3155]